MDFAITFKPDMPIDRILRLAQQAESAGFSYTWLFDSHVLWMEPFPLMALIAANTKKMHIGTCVTNPAVRDVTVTSSLFATLNLASQGRMEMGIGRGDSSRRVLGKKPTTIENLEEFVRTFRALNAGKSVDYEGVPTRFPWATAGVPRVWVAGYGPKALRTAGRIGDGVILQFADPDLIAWCMGFVREGAREAGRNPAKIAVMSAAPVWVSDDLKTAREHVRWFPALVSNHVVDLVSRYKPEELPASLTSFIRNRPGYNYLHHAEVGSDNASFVTDEIVDRFCIIGPASAHRKKLAALAAVGVTQFNIYLMSGEEEKTLDLYHREILQHAARS
ncbi:MAG TPA: TIGR03842 family LLM class F420-dependent oxidoreductase [Candidatus Dormibacteraeota bacterium]|nr:TIGR03842 family LLM class F420-dependent oxidoreductase [Candidatus Dormibacteraeota bacterium]